jgi:hypothetical protein
MALRPARPDAGLSRILVLEQLGKKRLRFTERRRLAVLGKKLGRKALVGFERDD